MFQILVSKEVIVSVLYLTKFTWFCWEFPHFENYMWNILIWKYLPWLLGLDQLCVENPGCKDL